MYTDGACSGNPGPGGWGAILMWNGHEKELSGHAPATTNNRMEMTAVLEGLRSLKKPCTVTVCTDSVYVLKGSTEWLPGWKRNGWKTSAGKPVENRDLWIALDTELQRHHVSFEWVKGHNGHPLNERADALATGAIRREGKGNDA
jgi:ribonuclease HI